jgi:hypothetical protein
MRSSAVAKKDNGRKGRKVLDLNTKILISIRDELRALNGTVQQHTVILRDHTDRLTAIEHRLGSMEKRVGELANETRKWVGHFDRDYLRLANDFDAMRMRVKRCEEKLSL